MRPKCDFLATLRIGPPGAENPRLSEAWGNRWFRRPLCLVQGGAGVAREIGPQELPGFGHGEPEIVEILHLGVEMLRLAAEQMAALAAVGRQEVEVPAGNGHHAGVGRRPEADEGAALPGEMELGLAVRGFDERRAG